MTQDNMADQALAVARGLEGVVAAETDISFVDGANSDLYYKGFNIHDIADNTSSYVEVVYLLLYGDLPSQDELLKFRRKLVLEMRVPTQVIKMMEMFPHSSHPMDVLRTATSALAQFDPDADDNSPEANMHKAIRLIAQLPTLIASLYRIRLHKNIMSPDPHQSMAANMLYMFHGKLPNETAWKAMDLVLLLHADHGLNASTFAARVTASTHADIHATITSAIGTLKGPLHGGANERVMNMLREIKSPDEVETYIKNVLNQGRRIMGFGHRIYKQEDPRTCHLRDYAEQLCQSTGNSHLFEISRRIEAVAMDLKGLYPNVDFYSGTVQNALGIPDQFFTTIFAAGRISGWVAHVLEQYRDNRLIRPTSRYIGHYNRKFIPIEERGGSPASES